ncbi:MAG: type II secretion system protein [Planctomycetota bacterium]
MQTQPIIDRRVYQHSGCSKGFTLVECLVCLCIVGLLAAVLAPAVQRARNSAANNECANRLRQIGAILHDYVSVYQRFPPHYDGFPGGWLKPVVETSCGSWPFDDNLLLQSSTNLSRAKIMSRPDLLSCSMSVSSPVSVEMLSNSGIVLSSHLAIQPGHDLINIKRLGRPISQQSTHTLLVEHTSQGEFAWPFPVGTDAPAVTDPAHQLSLILFEDGHVERRIDNLILSINP